MKKNLIREKEYQFMIIADKIDSLFLSMEALSSCVNTLEEEYAKTGEEWVKSQLDEQRRKLLAYDVVISYLEKFN